MDRYLNPPYDFSHPIVKDWWRLVSADKPNLVVVGWNGPGKEPSSLDLGLATGQWSGFIGGTDAIEVKFADMMTDSASYPLSLEQRAALRKWVESLPLSESIAQPEDLRVRIAVNLDGTQHFFQYTESNMPAVMGSLCQIMGWDRTAYIQ